MAENNFSLQKTLTMLLDEKKYHSLRDILSTMNPADIAAIFDDLDQARLPLLFRLLPKELAAETFVEMEPEAQELLIQGFSDSELKEVIDELYVDDAVDIVEEMPANVVQRILSQAEPDMRKQINEILRYPEDSAGSIMTTEYVSLRPNMTVEEAILRIRRTGIDKETVYTCYVIDDQRRLVGQVSLRKLIIAPESACIRDIMDTNIVSAATTDDQEAVADDFRRYDLTSIAVCDKEGRLVGIITIDDIVDVIQDENTEDIKKMAAIIPSDEDYMKTSVWSLVAHRLPWLMLLMISATFTSTIITHFETLLSGAVLLTAFIPMLMDSAGNSGSQTSVTVIRNLALGEIELRDWPHVLAKEIGVAIVSGAALALVNFLRIIIFTSTSMMIAAVVSVTLFCTVIIAMIVGCLLPIGAKKLGFDPAVMASPMITTIVDACSLMIYFLIATSMLGL